MVAVTKATLILHKLEQFFLVYDNESRRTCSLDHSSVTWIKKLSSTHSRSLLDFLRPAILFFQQRSEWLRSLMSNQDKES